MSNETQPYTYIMFVYLALPTVEYANVVLNFLWLKNENKTLRINTI